MSNPVTLTVGEFKSADREISLFGYFISDNYSQDYSFSWETKEDFLKSHPTAQSLWSEALSKELFDDITVRHDHSGEIYIEDNVPLPSEISTASTFFLEGISYE